MLFESISYQDQLPFELSFLNVAEESKHCHQEIEILLVLRGVTHYQIYHTDYELNPGDLIIADAEDLHQIHDSSEDILLLAIHVDTGGFEHLYPDIRYMFFVCEECMEGPSANKQLLQSKLALLKHAIARLAYDYMRENKDRSLLMSEINELISILVHHFQGFFMEDYQYKISQEDMSPDDLQRLCRITRFIMLHYDQKITLDDVSKMEHLSSFYLSHLIKENLGFNFQNFVNVIRLEFAEKRLVFTNDTLTRISQDCGFSSLNYFNKCFSAWYGKTPAQYRKAYIPKERSFQNPFTQEEALALLTPYLNVSTGETQLPKNVSLVLNFNDEGFWDFWETRAPRILLESVEDVLALSTCVTVLGRLRPSCFVLSETLAGLQETLFPILETVIGPLNVPLLVKPIPCSRESRASDLVSVFRQVLEQSPLSLRLLRKSNALFTKNGLETPLYQVLCFFSDFEKPQVRISENLVLVKDEHVMAALFFNEEPAPLNICLSAESLPKDARILRREIEASQCGRGALEALGQPEQLSPLLKKRIHQSLYGSMNFSILKEDLNLTVQPNSILILEIYC
ncbi:MAG: AraC family transcriptional regulator [Firmicutes bacterium]|nr:AraC family transcriptional regulator [Bacillota bacterium]